MPRIYPRKREELFCLDTTQTVEIHVIGFSANVRQWNITYSVCESLFGYRTNSCAVICFSANVRQCYIACSVVHVHTCALNSAFKFFCNFMFLSCWPCEWLINNFDKSRFVIFHPRQKS